jgi:HEAT repeat protein
LVRKIQVEGATEAFVKLLPKLALPAQIALLGGLGQRGDMAAEAAIAPFTRHPTPEVRLAAIDALGLLGGADSVSVLAEAAANATGAEQEAARQALVRLHHGEPLPAMLAQLTAAKPAVQAELARALGELDENAAFPKLLELAQTGPESASQTALPALALLASPAQLDSLVQLVVAARNEAARAQAAEAVRAACQRLLLKQGQVDVASLVKALAGAAPETRIALLPVCSGLADAQVRAALRAAVQDTHPAVRAAGLRALSDTTDPELFPDLRKAACQTPEENLRTLAIAGCVRVATREDNIKLPNGQKLEAFADILAAQPSADQKRLVLAGLGEVPAPQALQLAEPLLHEAAVQNEAGRAIIKIAPALADTALARAALKQALAAVQDPAARQAAELALKELDARADYILAWQVAGPYRQEGKNYAALFDIPFAPEIPVLPAGAAAPPTEAVNWQPLPPSTDPARPWSMDLLKALGGEQCVAYARTWIQADQEQRARLELGSDDGAKVWLNGQLVHANNTARPLQPGQDKVDVTLKKGWNSLLLKVTQNDSAWEFCVRFLKPDGAHLEGLRASGSAPQ